MNEIATTKNVASMAPSPLMDPATFDHLWRVGKLLAMSPLFPEHLRKGGQDSAIANGVLVMNMATRLNEDPLTVAQNIYFVSGKPGWSASYMIGKANQHGVFKNTISWEIEGEGETLSVTAFAELAATGQRVEATCGMKMAKAEGWTKNAKYNSMPEQMLRYRSATFLIRLYCPEVMIGVPSQVEIEMGSGMKDVTPNEYSDVIIKDMAEAKPKKPAKKPAPEKTAAEKAADENPATKPEKEPEGDVVDDTDKAPPEEEKKEAAPLPKDRDEQDVSRFVGLADSIKADLMDVGVDNIQDVLDAYDRDLKAMQAQAPDVHKSILEFIDAMKAEAKQ